MFEVCDFIFSFLETIQIRKLSDKPLIHKYTPTSQQSFFSDVHLHAVM